MIINRLSMYNDFRKIQCWMIGVNKGNCEALESVTCDVIKIRLKGGMQREVS